jgi:hypothetical protein
MVLNDTCNNILVVSWCSVLLVEETGVPRKNPTTCRKSQTNFEPTAGFKLTTLIVIATDCIGSYKSNYHTVMTTTAPQDLREEHFWYRNQCLTTTNTM